MAQGCEVWGLRRRIEELPPEIRGLRADLAEAMPDLPGEFEYMFIITTADNFEEAAYRRAYVDVASHVARLARESQPKLRRLFFVSSTSVYGQQAGEWVEEDTPAAAGSFSGRLIRLAEEVLFQSELPVTVVRCGGIYGPGRGRTVDRVRKGQASCAGGEPKYVNLIHRDDLVCVLEHLMKVGHPADVYIAVDHEPVAQDELLGWIARELHVPEPPLRVGEEDAYRRSKSNKRCRNHRLLGTGFVFAYPTYREGYGTLLHLS